LKFAFSETYFTISLDQVLTVSDARGSFVGQR